MLFLRNHQDLSQIFNEFKGMCTENRNFGTLYIFPIFALSSFAIASFLVNKPLASASMYPNGGASIA